MNIKEFTQSEIKQYIEQIRKNAMGVDEMRNIARNVLGTEAPTKLERMMRIRDHLNKPYVPYPYADDEQFHKKIFLKQEFHENQTKIDIEANRIEEHDKLCPSDRDRTFNLLAHQIFVRNYVSINTPYNGILLFHGMGSGKTCSAISIAEAYKKEIDSSGSLHSKILVLTSGETISNQFRYELHNVNAGYNQCTFSEYVNYKPYDKPDIKHKKAQIKVNQNYEFEGYQKMTNKIRRIDALFAGDMVGFRKHIQHNYGGRIIIVDEVHNLKQLKKKGDNMLRYNALMTILTYASDIKLILLSGTPISHSPKEIIFIINLLLVNDKREKMNPNAIMNKNGDLKENGAETLAENIRGYISFLTGEHPFTFPEKIFPKISSNAEKPTAFINSKFGRDIFEKGTYDPLEEYTLVLCKMMGAQIRTYMEYANSVSMVGGNTNEKHLASQALVSIQLSVVPTGKIANTVTFSDFSEAKLPDFAIKFYELLQNLKNAVGTVFIYSGQLKRSIFILIKVFLKYGYDFWEKKRKIKWVKNAYRTMRPRSGDRRCAICGDISRNHNAQHAFTPALFEFIVALTPEDFREKIRIQFNRQDNIDGSKLKIVIGSNAVREGISFLGVRNLHVMEPWHNKTRINQIIGRGTRHCSHRFHPPDARDIQIFLYCAILGSSIPERMKGYANTLDSESVLKLKAARVLSYDMIMYKRAESRNLRIGAIEKILQENAVDCMLNRQLNIDARDPRVRYDCVDYNSFDPEVDKIDRSTYENQFLTAYVNQAVSAIRDAFKERLVVYESEMRTNPKLQADIFSKDNYLVIRKAFATLVPIEKEFTGFQFIVQHKNTHGYLISRKHGRDNAIYIFIRFQDPQEIKRSEFEISPLYEMQNIDKITVDKNNALTLSGLIDVIQITDYDEDEKYTTLLKKGIKVRGSTNRYDHCETDLDEMSRSESKTPPAVRQKRKDRSRSIRELQWIKQAILDVGDKKDWKKTDGQYVGIVAYEREGGSEHYNIIRPHGVGVGKRLFNFNKAKIRDILDEIMTLIKVYRNSNIEKGIEQELKLDTAQEILRDILTKINVKKSKLEPDLMHVLKLLDEYKMDGKRWHYTVTKPDNLQ